jgi:hypothetical protein
MRLEERQSRTATSKLLKSCIPSHFDELFEEHVPLTGRHIPLNSMDTIGL